MLCCSFKDISHKETAFRGKSSVCDHPEPRTHLHLIYKKNIPDILVWKTYSCTNIFILNAPVLWHFHANKQRDIQWLSAEHTLGMWIGHAGCECDVSFYAYNINKIFETRVVKVRVCSSEETFCWRVWELAATRCWSSAGMCFVQGCAEQSNNYIWPGQTVLSADIWRCERTRVPFLEKVLDTALPHPEKQTHKAQCNNYNGGIFYFISIISTSLL